MSDELYNKVLNWVKKNGYPLEFQVANVLEQNGFSVIQSDYFLDPESNKSREIDVCGYKQKLYDEILVRITLVVECKSENDKPWLFLSSQDTNLSKKAQILQTPSTSLGIELLSILCENEKYQTMSLFSQEPRSSFSVTECFSEKDRPYDAINKVAKATSLWQKLNH